MEDAAITGKRAAADGRRMADKKLETLAHRPSHPRAMVIDCRPGFDGPYFRGEGDDNMVCGQCGHTLVQGVVVAMLTLYLCCPGCGRYNVADGHEEATSA